VLPRCEASRALIVAGLDGQHVASPAQPPREGNLEHSVESESETANGPGGGCAAASSLSTGASVKAGIFLPRHSCQPIGTPERCGARLEEIVSTTGIENFILGFEGPLSEAATIESMSRFASEVLPGVRRFASVAS
jgi:hypothetical protein